MKIFKNKLISLMAACALSVNTFSVIALANTGLEGDGSFENPYIISGAEDFVELSSAVAEGNSFEGKYFVQTADFEFENAPADETVVYGMGENEFGGIYDGCGNKIILADTYKEVNNEEGLGTKKIKGGLFGRLSGIIKNITVTGSWRLDGDGAVFAKNVIGNGKIINCGISDFKALHAYDWGTVFYGFASTADYDGTAIYNCFNYSEEFITSTGESYPITDNPSAAENSYYYLKSTSSWGDGTVAENEYQKITEIKMAGLYRELNSYIETLTEPVAGVDRYGITLWKGGENAPESKKEYYSDPVEVEYEFEGEGTYESPYLIGNIDDFNRMLQYVKDGVSDLEGIYFSQTADIAFVTAKFGEELVYGLSKGEEFAGIYNGNGYKITMGTNYNHIAGYEPEDMGVTLLNQGLFGRLSGVVMNVTLRGYWRLKNEGGLIAHSVVDGGKIINCSTQNFGLWAIFGSHSFFGFASTEGYLGTAIYNCFFTSHYSSNPNAKIYLITDTEAYKDCWYHLDGLGVSGKVDLEKGTPVNANEVKTLHEKLNAAALENAKAAGVEPVDICTWKASTVAGSPVIEKYELIGAPVFDGATFTHIGIEGETVIAAGESYIFTAATHFKDAQNIKVKLDDVVISEYVVDGVYENIVEIPAGYITEGKHTVTLEGLDGDVVKYTDEKMIVADAAFVTNVRVSGELNGGSKIEVTADITNCMSEASDVTLLIGVYNEKGKLVARGINKYPAVVGEKNDAEVAVMLPEADYDGCKAYFYIWNNVVSMKAMRAEMLIME